jgi:ATP-dependent Lhr-like helicase
VISFEQLHPARRYHIVNTMGWSDLRPTQRDAIAPIHAGEDVLLLAPTAGGKTEAAVLPLLSRAASQSWTGLSALYLCPLKALLNNLEPRFSSHLENRTRRKIPSAGIPSKSPTTISLLAGSAHNRSLK